MREIRLSLVVILILAIVCSGCSLSSSNKVNPSSSSDTTRQKQQNDDEKKLINKYNIDKITVYFSYFNEHYKRSISVIPTEDAIVCSYNSDYLDNALFCTISQDKYKSLCDNIISFSEQNWKTKDLENYDEQSYKTKKLGQCRVCIDSNKYPLDSVNTDNNLCSALLVKICVGLFDELWKSTVNLDMPINNKICYLESSGQDDDDSTVNYINYVADKDLMLSTKEEQVKLDAYKSLNSSNKILELYNHTPDSTSLHFASLYDYLPLEFELFTIISKTNHDEFKKNDDKKTIKTNKKNKIIEHYFKYEKINIGNEKTEYYLTDSSQKETDKGHVFSTLKEWSNEIINQFF